MARSISLQKAFIKTPNDPVRQGLWKHYIMSQREFKVCVVLESTATRLQKMILFTLILLLSFALKMKRTTLF